MLVRKLIVKAFVREVILDNDNVTITYNFTENYTKYRVTQEIIQKVQRPSRKKTAYNKNLCSYKLPPLPPQKITPLTGVIFLSSRRDEKPLGGAKKPQKIFYFSGAPFYTVVNPTRYNIISPFPYSEKVRSRAI